MESRRKVEFLRVDGDPCHEGAPRLYQQEKEGLSGKVLVEKVPAKGSATIHRWPTRLQRKMIQAGDSVARRDAVEKEERTRWIREIRDLLREGGCPATAGALNTAGQDLSRKFGKGRRMSTLRKHAKTWQKVRDWTMVTFRHPWPESPEEFVAYLESRADEPCGHTIPGSIFKTLMFMENAGEYPPAEQLGKSPAIKNALEEINMQLASNAPNLAPAGESGSGYGGGRTGCEVAKVCQGLRMVSTGEAMDRHEVL